MRQRDPGGILADPGMSVLDLDRPVALLLVAVLHFLTDEYDPYAVVTGSLMHWPRAAS